MSALPAADGTSSDTRERALDCAETLMLELGYRGVSMEALARAVGIKKASLYHHFPGGKEEIFASLARRHLAQMQASYDTILATLPDVRGRLKAILAYWLRPGGQSSHLLRDAMRFMPVEQQRLMAEAFERHVAAPVRTLLEQGVASGELRAHDTHLITWTLLAAVSQQADMLQHPSGLTSPTPLESVPERLVDVLLDGLKNS